MWNSLWPDGSKSVKQNTVPGQQNTTYTETTLNNDHYWNIGTNEDGHHRSVQMQQFINSAIGAPADAPIASGMEGATYLKLVAGTVQGFYRNGVGIYQYIPAFLTGSVALNTSGYTIVTAVPNNTYGQIWMWRTGGANKDVQFGSFFTPAGICVATAAAIDVNGGSPSFNVHFGNGTSSSGNLNFIAKVASGAAGGVYAYRIIYWGM